MQRCWTLAKRCLQEKQRVNRYIRRLTLTKGSSGARIKLFWQMIASAWSWLWGWSQWAGSGQRCKLVGEGPPGPVVSPCLVMQHRPASCPSRQERLLQKTQGVEKHFSPPFAKEEPGLSKLGLPFVQPAHKNVHIRSNFYQCFTAPTVRKPLLVSDRKRP